MNVLNYLSMKNSLRTLLLSALVGLSMSAQAMTSPDQVARQTVDKIVNNIQANRALYKKDSEALFQMVEDTLVPALHVQRMSNLILGKHGRKASDEQKASFANEFKTFLMRSYASALLEYTGEEKVIYKPLVAKPGADKVVVKAELVSAEGKSYPINLYMSNRRDDSWRAYNMEVAGINFVSTYRATFGDIAAKKGVDGLIADLKKKNTKLAS